MTLGASVCVKGSIEAVEFYEEAFGLTSAHHGINSDGTYGHAELLKDGKYIFSLSEAGDANQKLVDMILSGTVDSIMNFGIDFETEAEVYKAFEMLSEGGRVIRTITSLP